MHMFLKKHWNQRLLGRRLQTLLQAVNRFFYDLFGDLGHGFSRNPLYDLSHRICDYFLKSFRGDIGPVFNKGRGYRFARFGVISQTGYCFCKFFLGDLRKRAGPGFFQILRGFKIKIRRINGVIIGLIWEFIAIISFRFDTF